MKKLLILVSLVFFSCNQDVDSIAPAPIYKPAPMEYHSTVIHIDDYTYESVFTINGTSHRVTFHVDDSMESLMEIQSNK